MDSWHDVNDDEDNDAELRNLKFGGKDALIFLIDSSPKMHVKPDDIVSEEDESPSSTPFQMALDCVRATLQNKIFSSPSDVLGLLLFGTKEKVDVRDFDNLSLVLPMSIAEGQSILKIEDLINDPQQVDQLYGSSDKYAIHEALWQCQSMFNEVKGKTAVRKILLFTSNDNPHANDQGLKRHALKKGTDLQGTEIILEVIPLLAREETFDWKLFYRDMLPTSQDSDESKLNETLLEASTRQHNDLLKVVRKKLHTKRSVGKLTLDLGHGVKIALSTYNLVQRASKPSKMRLARDTNEPVRCQRNFIHPRTGAPLMPTDIELQQSYGDRKICFTADEVKSISKMDMEPGLKLFGFKSLGDLRFSQFVRAGNFIYPEESMIKGSRNLFAALLKRCLERSLMAICAFKPRDRSTPTFVALIPLNEVKDPEDGVQIVPSGFSLFYLPFVDDLREVPEMHFTKPEDEQLAVARQLVGKLKLKKFTVESFDNPSLQAHYRLLETLALDRPDVSVEPDNTLPPFERMRKKLKDLPERFHQCCGYIPGGTTKRKPTASATASQSGQPRKKAAKGEIVDISEYVTSKTVNKLTVDKLKAYLSSVGESVHDKRKQQLVDAVYDYFQFMD